jgi:nickel-dependent lactate racemase
MTQNQIDLPWGKEKLSLTLPEDWRLAGVLEPAALPPVADVPAEVRRSLAEPVASPRLSELIRPGMKAVLVIDDGSRPTPVAQILPVVLEEMLAAGMKREDITLVPAIGVHQPMAPEEIAARAGAENFAGLNLENPACDDPDHLVYLGRTRRKTPVWVNKTVALADVVVSIGCIEPHFIASFGGGYKNLIPGVAGRTTIARNHALNCSPTTFNMVGQPIEGNPMRLDLEEAGRMLKPPVFIVNAVMNSAKQVVRIVAGDAVAAHRAGAEVSARLYGVHAAAPADVVICSSHPMDQDFRQGGKALTNTIWAVKPGGVMIIAVRAEEGLGVFGLADRKLPLGRAALKALAPVLLPLVPRLKLKSVGDEEKLFLYFALQAMLRADLLMYAPTIPAATRENLVFGRFFNSLEEAFQAARQKVKPGAKVLVFPHAGVTYPYFAN